MITHELSVSAGYLRDHRGYPQGRTGPAPSRQGWRVLPVPRIVGRADALDLGYDDDAIARRVRSGRWRRVLPHTYLTVDTLTWLDQQLAALTFAGPCSLLSGAPALHGELRAVRQPSTLLVLVPYDIAPRSVDGVHIRRTVRMPQPRRALGPRRAPVARAIADLAL